MAADIVVLDIREITGGLCNIRFCCWLSVAQAYPNAGFTSAYPDINTDLTVGTAAGNYPAALTAGTLSEEVYSLLMPASTIANNWATLVEPLMLAVLTARKAYKAGTAPAVPTPGLKYKILHDSVSGWSA